MDVICQKCGVVNECNTILAEPPHYCKSFIQWLPNPSGSYRQRCKEQLERALNKEPNNKFYQSLKVYFDKNKALTPAQFNAINKF